MRAGPIPEAMILKWGGEITVIGNWVISHLEKFNILMT